jgi:hypothetical protein
LVAMPGAGGSAGLPADIPASTGLKALCNRICYSPLPQSPRRSLEPK